MASSEMPTQRCPELPTYRDESRRGHAWKMICGSIGFQLGLLVIGSSKSAGLGVLIVALGSVAGVAAGAWLDRPQRRSGSPSGLRHLFVLLFQFALMFAWLKAWGDLRH
jgi:hypothetical protein